MGAYQAHQQRTGRGNSDLHQSCQDVPAALAPRPRVGQLQPLSVQLRANSATRPFLTFLLVTGRLHPDWDYLVHRKFSSIWRDVGGTAIGADLETFIVAARAAGFSQRVASAMASQVMAGVLFATGKPLAGITHSDFDALTTAGIQPAGHHRPYLEALPGHGHGNQDGAVPHGRANGPARTLRTTVAVRQADGRRTRTDALDPGALPPPQIGHLQTGDCVLDRHQARALRDLPHQLDPSVTPATLHRVHHIEPWLTALTQARNSNTGAALSTAEQARRILAVANFLSDIGEWDWPEAPTRKLLHPGDNPKLPQPLPRFLPPDADRRLTQALQESPHRLAADALLLQRACGLRIGELLDLELDAVIDIPASGSWLKVPLGKLDTERMVPIDDEILWT